jgi:hypothetical protein
MIISTYLKIFLFCIVFSLYSISLFAQSSHYYKFPRPLDFLLNTNLNYQDKDDVHDRLIDDISTFRDYEIEGTLGRLQVISNPIFDNASNNNMRSSTTTKSLDFDGIDDFIDYGDENTFEFTSAFTLEAWVLQQNTVAVGTILSKSNANSGNEMGYKLVLNNGVPNLKWYNSSGDLIVNLISPYVLNNNKWYHISVAYDGTTAKLYIDGLMVASCQPTAAPDFNTEKFIIGATYNSNTPSVPENYFDGFIDEVRIWDVALTIDQLHEMMNQEIEQNGTAVRGKVIPLNISGGLQWSNLKGYYDMKDDDATDKSSFSKNGMPKNMTTLQEQTAPLPYTTKADGNWSDISGTSPWTWGDTVWDAPNTIGVDGITSIDWNIVVTSHNVTIESYTSLGRERKLLGLIVNSNTIRIKGDNTLHTGNGLTVTKYLKLDGDIDLGGESQLIQTSESILDVNSPGKVVKDQQGTKDLYTYTYWSSPVGISNTTTNNNSYTLPNILKDGTNPESPAIITFLNSGYNGISGSPISIADYWIWKYTSQPTNTYSIWQHVRSTGTILAGQGFTMKGVANTNGNVTLNQNYVFNGKPNNGNITLNLNVNNDYLVGNPYPSALDADEFIKDNLETNGRNSSGNIINGTLYFWDHFASGTHVLATYEGGYATYTLMGGVAAITNDTRINATGGAETKTPERYIPVSQGFVVSAILDAGLVGQTQPVVGGSIIFKNSQRIFKKEAVSGSNIGSVFLRTNSSTSKSKSSNEKSSDEIADPRQKIRLMFDSPKGYHRPLLAGVDANTSNVFDLGYDAPLIENNEEDMYWLLNNTKFTIQAVNNFNNEQALPFGIKTSKAGISKIRIESLENMDKNTKILIHDKDANTYHNLKDGVFQVNLPAGTYTNKYEIVFNTPNSTGESLSSSENEFNSIEIYYSNNSKSIVINNPSLTEIKSIELINILGQSIMAIRISEQKEVSEFNVKNLSQGAYVLKMHTVSGSVSKKVLVK